MADARTQRSTAVPNHRPRASHRHDDLPTADWVRRDQALLAARRCNQRRLASARLPRCRVGSFCSSGPVVCSFASQLGPPAMIQPFPEIPDRHAVLLRRPVEIALDLRTDQAGQVRFSSRRGWASRLSPTPPRCGWADDGPGSSPSGFRIVSPKERSPHVRRTFSRLSGGSIIQEMPPSAPPWPRRLVASRTCGHSSRSS